MSASTNEALPGPGELIRLYGQRARKAFGQNFLSDVHILDRIVGLAELAPGDRVIEIGPGPGGLTTRLLAAGAQVRAVELDRDVVEHLERTFGAHERFSVVQGDALQAPLPEWVAEGWDTVVANLPYHVATPILFRLLDAPSYPRRMALMFQMEVAERLVAAAGTREFSLLGLGAQIRYRTRLAMRLKPGAFTPPPKVRSGVVLFERRDTPLVDAATEAVVRQLGKAAFQQRRKTLRNSLRSLTADPDALLSRVGLSATARPESIAWQDWFDLATALTSEREQ